MTEQKTEQLRLRRINLEIWAAIIVLGLAALVSYFLLDERVFRWLYQHPNKWHGNNWLQAFTLLGKGWVLIWLLLSWVWATGRPARGRPALVAILALLLVLPTIPSLKVLAQRPRPADIVKVHSRAEDRIALIRSWSFPSGDAAAVFAVATALAPFVRRQWSIILFTISSIIGILRVVVLAHYPSDVCAGAAIGMLISRLAWQITSRCQLPLPSGFNWYRAIAAVGMIVIPLSLGLFEGINQLLTFLKTYGVLVLGIYIAAKAGTHLKKLQKHVSCDH
jgi:undecaprenyl-diphosphatase